MNVAARAMPTLGQPEVAREHALYIQNSNSIYTYIPKNGCTNLRHAIVEANSDGTHQFDQMGRIARSYIATEDQLARLDYIFVVYRCPFRRISSLFLDKIVTDGYPLKKLRANSFSGSRIPLLPRAMEWLYNRNILQPIDRDTFTFRDFLRLLEYPQALSFNHHWTPQSWFGIEQLGQRYDDVFSLERFQQAVPIIAEKAKITVEDVRKISNHSTQGFTKVTEGCFADTPVNELREMKAANHIPAHSAMFDDEAVNMVSKLYGDDIAMYRHHFGADDLLFS